MNSYSLSISYHRIFAIIAVIAMVMWSTGFPSFIRSSEAVNLTFISDTLSDSDLGVSADHTIVFTTQTAVPANGASTTITFDPSFNLSTSTATGFDFSDIDVATTGPLTLGAACGAVDLAVSVTATEISFEHCSGANGAFAAGGTTTITMGTNAGGAGNLQIINPENAQSYEIIVTTYDNTYTALDEGRTRIAIIDDVLVTASVDTRLVFQIFGLAAGASVNGSPTTTATSTTPTTLPFETLAPDVSKTLAQSISVETNARNGFSVTLNQNQNLLSSTGADIDRFQNDTPPGSPVGWTPPTGTLGSENTYGHMGITSEDSTLSTGDDFGSDLWSGNFVNNPREVLYNDEPSDGIQADTGSTTVGFQAEIMSFQEAGTDYQAIITYVATPVF